MTVQTQTITVSRTDKFRTILLWLGWAALLGFLCARGLGRGPTADFKILWNAARTAGAGGSLYTGSEWWQKYYFYGPVFSVIFQPLAWLSLKPAFFLWTLGSVAAIPAAAITAGEALKHRFGKSLSPLILLGAAVILIVPFASNFRHGNINTFLLLLLVLAYYALAAGRSGAAGLILALTATFKVTPLLFLPWLIFRKEWRGVAGFLAGIVLWVALVPALFYGPRRTMEETRYWVGTVLLPVVKSAGAEGPEALHNSGSSLPRIVVTLLADRGRNNSGEDHKEDSHPAFAVMSAGWAKIIAYVLAVGGILITLLVTRREKGFGVIGFGLVAATMLIVSPVSRGAHFVQLYPLVACLMAMAFQGNSSEKRLAGRTLIAGISVTFLLLGSALLAGFSSKAFFHITGLTLVLWFGGLVAINCGREDSTAREVSCHSPGT